MPSSTNTPSASPSTTTEGYLLARAYMPAQRIKDGIVTIAILEGKLGKLNINNSSQLAAARADGYLANLKQDQALNAKEMEKDLLLLSDIQGVKVKSTLRPGESVGTADLDVSLMPETPYKATVFLDNYGGRYTGRLRAGGYFTLGNLTGGGDTLSLQAQSSTDMHYGRAAWQVPVNNAGTQVGAALSAMRYYLIEDYKSLDASGTATVGNLYLLHPLIRSRYANLNAQLSYEHKQLDDDIDSTSTQTRKRLNNIALGLSGDRMDNYFGGGANQGSLSLTFGHLKLDNDSKSLDDSGYRTAGGFTKLNLSAARLQRLNDDWTLYANIRGQMANKNLDSAEKMGLGGAQGVRAYPQGESPADDAVLATIELRYRFKPDWQASAFYDNARAKLNHAPLATDTDNIRHLSGYGLGLSYTHEDISLNMTVAWRNGSEVQSGKERQPRLWAQAVKQF